MEDSKYNQKKPDRRTEKKIDPIQTISKILDKIDAIGSI